MREKKTAAGINFLITFTAVFLIFYAESYAVPGADWNAATLNAAFDGRHQPGALVYNGKMWFVGGTNGASVHMNDVWSSNDGANWTLVNAGAPFAGRNTFAYLDYLNRMWVISGSSLNDSWWSTDGVAWTCANINCAFPAREATTGVVFDNGTGSKMWVIAGWDGVSVFFADAWYSSDGVSWNAATRNAAFLPVRSHSCAVYNGKMWLIGGTKFDMTLSKEVWYSSNGADWYAATLNAAFGQIAQQQSVVFDNKMWLIGGMDPLNNKSSSVWWSVDGADWYLATGNAAYGGLDTEGCVIFNNRIYALSGYPLRKEVWYTELPPVPTFTVTPTCTSFVSPTFTATASSSPTVTITPTPYPGGDLVVYPNPYNPATAAGGTLKFLHVKPGSSVRIYSLSGELIAMKSSAADLIEWDARNLSKGTASPGVYFYLIAGPNKAIAARGKLFIIRK
jgi:hypothetical protein